MNGHHHDHGQEDYNDCGHEHDYDHEVLGSLLKVYLKQALWTEDQSFLRSAALLLRPDTSPSSYQSVTVEGGLLILLKELLKDLHKGSLDPP